MGLQQALTALIHQLVTACLDFWCVYFPMEIETPCAFVSRPELRHDLRNLRVHFYALMMCSPATGTACCNVAPMCETGLLPVTYTKLRPVQETHCQRSRHQTSPLQHKCDLVGLDFVLTPDRQHTSRCGACAVPPSRH